MAMFLSGLFRLKWSGAEVINEKREGIQAVFWSTAGESIRYPPRSVCSVSAERSIFKDVTSDYFPANQVTIEIDPQVDKSISAWVCLHWKDVCP